MAVNGVGGGVAGNLRGEGHGVAGGKGQVSAAVVIAIHGHQRVVLRNGVHQGAVFHHLCHRVVRRGGYQLRLFQLAHYIGVQIGFRDQAGHAGGDDLLRALGHQRVGNALLVKGCLHRHIAQMGVLPAHGNGRAAGGQVHHHHFALAHLHMAAAQEVGHGLVAGGQGGLLLGGILLAVHGGGQQLHTVAASLSGGGHPLFGAAHLYLLALVQDQLHICRTCAVGGGIEGAAVVVQARVGGNGVDRLAVNEHIHALVRRSGAHADAYGQAQHRQRRQQSQQSVAVGRLSLLPAKKG